MGLVLDIVPTVCFILLDLDSVWIKLSLIYRFHVHTIIWYIYHIEN
jgi:hypothetical protein